MASRNYEKRQTQKRKTAQAEQRYLAALRREAVLYEGITERYAAKMSKARLEETVKRGKRRKGLTGAPIGIQLSMAAASLLAAYRRS